MPARPGRPLRFAACLLAGCLVLPAAVGRAADEADSPGQADLDAAIDAKLSVDQLDDYAKVLDLCRQAVDKGLPDDSRKFAEELYTGTLMDRAGMLVEAIFESPTPDEQWPRMRAFAMRDLDEVVKRDPAIGQAHLMIARLESLPRGNRERAVTAATKALELVGDDRLQRAQAHLVLGSVDDDVEKRLEQYAKAVELAPRDVEIRRTRGLALLVEDKFDDARADLVVATEEEPDDASLFEALGMACMMGDRLDEAEKAFDRALEIDPEAVSVLLQRARLLAVRGAKEKALDDIEKVLEATPDDATARLLRARVHQQAGDTDKALADLEDVLRNEPDLASALELRGLIAAEQGDYAAAIRDFRRLVAKNGGDPVLLAQLGTLYLAAKQPREAIKRFTRALEIDEENFPCRRGRSDAERAIDLARKACEKTEWKEAHIVSTLAAGHAEAGDFEAARKFSQQAVDLGDGAADVTEQLKNELANYEAGKPWRERQETPDAGAESLPKIPGTEPAPAEQPAPPAKARRPFDE
jgi:tetratricopeptide (TPR) repeat protein